MVETTQDTQSVSDYRKVLKREHILRAIEEFDTLGPDGFHDRYGFGDARYLYLQHEGRRYPSKGIFGVARKFTQIGQPLRYDDFPGGQNVRSYLEDLGFTVVDARGEETRLNETAYQTMLRSFRRHVGNGFKSFADAGPVYEGEVGYKRIMLEEVRQLMEQDLPPGDLAKSIIAVQNKHPFAPIRWQTIDAAEKTEGLAGPYYETIGLLADRTIPAEERVDNAIRELTAMRDRFGRNVDALRAGERWGVVLSVLSLVDPMESAFCKVTLWNRIAKRLGTGPLFPSTDTYDPNAYDGFRRLLQSLFDRMTDDGLNPRDFHDIQSFVWIAERWSNETESETEEDETEEGNAMMQATPSSITTHPLNQILFGPPGTGKTYRTATIAAEICDGTDLSDRSRDDVMARYRDLREAGRILFTTFHQSTSYEEFVEGLRPVEGEGTGLRLEPRHGLFRKICVEARQAGAAGADKAIDLGGRQFFKMSLGRSGSEDHIFREAVKRGKIGLGWGGQVNWSDDRFRDYEAVKARWREDEPGAHGMRGDIVQTWNFQRMNVGDIVIVSDGNLKFRAIAEVTGDYEFDPDGGKDDSEMVEGKLYQHLRPVRWLALLDESLPYDSISDKRFSQTSCYRLDPDDLNLDAIAERISAASDAGPVRGPQKPYVLIIDEINRADMAKVFGELITLLEPDKRRGALNAIELTLPYSQDRFSVPSNLYVIGTMNTADRSIALIDTALRRRFEFSEVAPDPSLLDGVDISGVNLGTLLRTMNDRIEFERGRDHLIGHAYFLGTKTKADLDKVMRQKIIPLLAEYFYDDWASVARILGDVEAPTGDRRNGFFDVKPIHPYTADAQVFTRWSVRAEPFSYDGLVPSEVA